MGKRLSVVKRPASTVSGVLRQTIRLIEQEGRWVKGKWFAQGATADGMPEYHGTIDPEQPLCEQGWGACSDGMVQSVIFGVPYVKEYGECTIVNDAGWGSATDEQESLYFSTRKALDVQASVFLADEGQDIISLNDRAQTTRTDVLDVFRKAYRHAQYVERKARALQSA